MPVEEKPVPAGFKERLWSDLEAHRLVQGTEAGRISQSYYLELFGLPSKTKRTAIKRICSEVESEVARRSGANSISTEDAERWIEERYVEQSLYFDWRNRTSRRQLCDFFNIDLTRLCARFPEIDSILQRWDRKLLAENYRHDPRKFRAYKVYQSQVKRPLREEFFIYRREVANISCEDRLREALQSDFANACLAFTKPGVISRTHYSEKAGIGAIARFTRIFRHYEALVGGERIPFEDEIASMEAFLRENLESGLIKIRGTTFEKGPFLSKYGITDFIANRNPHIRAMFERINADIASGNIRSSLREEKLASLQKALKSAPLNPDGLKINRPFLVRATGLTDAKIRSEGFSELVAQEEAKRFAELQSDPLRAFLFGKVYDFRPLLDAWKTEVVAAVTAAFVHCSVGRDPQYLKGLRGYYFEFLTALALGQTPAAKESFDAINRRRDLPHAVWNAFLSEFNGRYVSDIGNVNTREAYLRGLNVAIDTLGRAGVLPKTSFRLSAKRPAGKHIKNFAEIVPSKPTAVGPANQTSQEERNALPLYEEHVQYAKWQLLQRRLPGDAPSTVEDEAFFDGLRQELKAAGVSIPNDPVEALTQLMELRVNKLKNPLIATVEQWREHYEKGQLLLELAFLPEGYRNDIEPSKSTGRPRRFLRSLFPNEKDHHQGKANLLLYVMENHGGIFPAPEKSGLGTSFYTKLCNLYGGIDRLQAYLVPHRNAVAASCCLYLLETGANVAVGRTLNADAIEPSDVPGFCRITGEKARAQGKPIIVELPSDSPAAASMKWLVDSMAIARAAAPEEIADLLFLRRKGYEIADLNAVWYLLWFKDFVEQHEDLLGLLATPNMIRPTILLLHSLKNDGNLRIGMAYAQHGENVAGIYQIREPTKYLYDRVWRKYQKQLQTLTIYEGTAARKLLGISDADNEENVTELKRTGLGGYCRAGGCDTPQCHSCPSFAIVAFPEDIADLQIWNESLNEVEGDWIRDRVERWEAEWLDWHCFTEVVQEKMQEGRLRRIWREAIKIKETRMAEPDFSPPRPY